MNSKEFRKYLVRDQGRCWHCGKTGDDLVPQHRINRGMGGSKSSKTNGASNILTFCSIANGQIESDSSSQAVAKRYGWKLSTFEDPSSVVVFDAYTGSWYLLDDQFGRHLIA